MAVAPLNLSVSLQAWHSAGLGFLLMERPVEELLAGLPKVEQTPRQPRQPQQLRTEQPAPPSFEAAQEPSEHNAGDGGRPRRDLPRRDQAGGGLAGRNQTTFSARHTNPRNFVPEQLPSPWSTLLGKVSPGPVVWVYPELGLDLLGLVDPAGQADSGGSGSKAASQERGQALRTIIGALKLKKGTNTFWPTSLPDAAGRLQGNRDLFHGGLDYLGAKYLMVFGDGTLAGTDYEGIQLRAFTEQISDGRMIIALPDFATLIQDRARLDSIVVFLRSVFARVFPI